MNGILKKHMPARILLPEFLRGLKALIVTGKDLNHEYFMMYEVERKKDFDSKKYLYRIKSPLK